MTRHKPKVVVIGGGSGISNLLRGLKQYDTELTAVVTMFDSGGSSGLLQTEFGYPPFGDLRQCLLALAEDTRGTEGIRDALDYRFGGETSLGGHTVGNLLLAALTSLNGGLEEAIQDVSQVLNVAGSVVPVTLEQAELCAELEDETIIQGESSIDLRAATQPAISRIFLSTKVQGNPKAIKAAEEADVILFGPGDLYTSVLPNLLPDGMVEAIGASPAIRVYVCNLMTKRGETDGYDASDFARVVMRYLYPASLDWVLINTSVPAREVLQAYAEEGANFVDPALQRVKGYVAGTIAAPLASDELPIRHDPAKTAATILQVWQAGGASEGPIATSASS